eukprot:TRINITY_DN21282_c0_g6_i1.p1 TRINITY_DN21282_c0_g6~~TRINITY_DN21282_c0_g6_i1.p1  ORF type:complete len:577 (+),score=86.05 TRINITY_DN21282_c0_g6_i1:47-1777(+)
MEGAETDDPTPEEIAICASVLRRMQPSDLELPQYSEVLAAGPGVFRRHIMKDKFGSKDAVEFLKEKTRVRELTTKMERLHTVVVDAHEQRRKKAQSCGMNLRRKADLAKIIADSSKPDEDDETALSITYGDVSGESKQHFKVGEDLALKPGIDASQCREARLCDERTGEVPKNVESACKIPRDSLYYACNMCRGEYMEQHHFYHQLCPRCAELNWQKREQTADMTGMVCVVTGGRVRIGYAIVLKLLRAGALVVATTRFPNDCLRRYSQEPDFESWRDRLEVVGPVEFCDLKLVEQFCDDLIRRFPRIHVLINNAAQTLTRPAGWTERMLELESRAATSLTQSERSMLRLPVQSSENGGNVLRLPSGVEGQASAAHAGAEEDPKWREATIQLRDFPEGLIDESRQPLDLSATNSWARRLGSISTVELLQTLAANTAAPFILCSRLACVLSPQNEGEPYGHVVNVSALEGKFSVRNKSSGHPHTNMAKAALNMLTHTSSKDLFQRRVLMNCVDTGWVTDMAPGGVGVVAAQNATWVGPPLDEDDGAARVLDPVFSHLNNPSWLVRGKFFKNYFVCQW